LTYDDNVEISAKSVSEEFANEFIDPKSIAYGIIIKIIQVIYEKVTGSFIQEYNYQFKKDYNDAIAN
jgi:hypothetical protein